MTIIQTSKPLQPRRDYDFYETPIELCRAALRKYVSPKFMGNILDPGCGNGNWGKAIASYIDKNNYYLAGIDIRKEVEIPVEIYDDLAIGDFINYRNLKMRDELQDTAFPQFDLIIGNPPYKYAEEFIRQSFELLKDGGKMIFLLRLAFLEGQVRGKDLWKNFPPVEVAISSRRVSFTNNGKSDNTAYAIYCWIKGYDGPTFLDWLDWDYNR